MEIVDNKSGSTADRAAETEIETSTDSLLYLPSTTATASPPTQAVNFAKPTIIPSRKRVRSSENDEVSPRFEIRSKVYVNQRMADANDPERVRAAEDRTMSMLFRAAHSTPSTNTTSAEELAKRIDLARQISLRGNGDIQLRDFTSPFAIEFKRCASRCCNRHTLVQAECTNCSLPLCEYCGYTCVGDCGAFICGACVTVFGSGTKDQPLCEKCEMQTN